MPEGPEPDFGVYLLGKDPGPFAWPHRWVRWPDFRTPASTEDAIDALQEAVRLEPESGEAHYQLGLALARAGKKDEATAALARGRELVAAADRDQSIALDLAEARAAMARGEHDRAVTRLQHAVRLPAQLPAELQESLPRAGVLG